jgi:RHS repeat-associated protein
MREDGVVYYFHTDHLGSTSAMSDGAGNAYGDPVRYLPFGEVRSGDLAEGLPTDHGFTGHKHSSNIRLVDMKARWYSAEIGRFVQPDTIIPDPTNPQSFNRYSYVNNRPCSMVDPSGHCGADLNPDGSVNQAATEECVSIRDGLVGDYSISITGIWTLNEMGLLSEGLAGILAALDSDTETAFSMFEGIFGGVRLNRKRGGWHANAYTKSRNRITFHDGTFFKPDITNKKYTSDPRDDASVYETISHELGHVWDRRSGRDLSDSLRQVVEGEYEFKFLWFEFGEYTVGIKSSWTSPYDLRHPPNEREDWAYTFAAFVVDKSMMTAPERISFVQDAIDAER